MPGPGRAVDLLVRHARAVTMDDAGRILPDGAIAIAGGVIVGIGPDAEIAERVHAARTIDARGAPVHPGLVECHVHASFQLLRGIHADDDPEDDILDGFYIPWLNLVTDEDEHLAVLLACLEMVRNGTTCFLEAGTVLEPDAAERAVTTVGMRASLGDPFIWDQPASISQGRGTSRAAGRSGDRALVHRAPSDLDGALARLGEQVRRNADPDARVTGHICVNGLGTASEALLREAKRRADDAGVIMDMHHAYSRADTDADRERYGRDPLVHLADIGVIGRNVTLGHANHLTDDECDVVVGHGTSLVWAPAASMLWAHGVSRHGRHAELFGRGANIALGSDSANWANDFDLFRQADLALLSARDASEDRTILGAGDVLWMATRGGARAAGLEDRIGSLEVGKRADLVIHDATRPELVPAPDAIRALVHASHSKSVRTVVIDGRVVLDDGEFPHLDEAANLARADAAARSMFQRLEDAGVRLPAHDVGPVGPGRARVAAR